MLDKDLIMEEKRYEIVSLGYNCLPRTILTRGGIKPRKADGELSCPFDLVRHVIPNIIHYLKTNFEDYFDDMYFEVRKRHFLDFRKKGIWKKKDGTKFFHDKDCKAEDIEKLQNRIKNRINNFYKIINADVPILFIIYLENENDTECLEELLDTLKSMCKNKKIHMVVLDFNNSVKTKITNSQIHILQLPEPCQKYKLKWNTGKFRKSELGIYVEKCICEYVKNILANEYE